MNQSKKNQECVKEGKTMGYAIRLMLRPILERYAKIWLEEQQDEGEM